MANRKQTKKAKQTKQRKPIKRQTRHFQLRIGEDYPVDKHVGEILDYKRQKRSEVTAIRDGVRLLWALENNDLSVLFEMFPQYKGQFLPDGVSLIEQIQGILSKTVAGQGDKQPIGFGQGPKQIEAPKFAMPIFEEGDEPTVLIRASTNTDSSANFVTALKNMA